MKHYRKMLWAVIAVLSVSCFSGSTAFAAGWERNDIGWWYDQGDGSWPEEEWMWIDGNQDGIAECYYFETNGYCLLETVTPDGYQVNADGDWIENGVVQTKSSYETSRDEADNAVQMRITVGDQVFMATLEDNATARAIAEQLPQTLPMMDLYGREMCYRFANAFPSNEARVSSFEVGDIIYWPPRHSFVIMYHQDGEQFQMQKVGAFCFRSNSSRY